MRHIPNLASECSGAGFRRVPVLLTAGCFAVVFGAILLAASRTARAGAAAPARPSAERSAMLDAQLAAGEFVNAMRTAEKAADPAERSRLIKKVVDAQIQAGAFDAALSSIRRIPQTQQRGEARSEHAVQRSLAGGGVADFSPLIDLIQNETTGPWVDTEGIGGTIDSFDQGIRVDPKGMLARLTRQEHTTRLRQLGISARTADLNEDVARPSNLRLISLTQLEREAAQRAADAESVVETMKLLAGIYEVRYLFVCPETGDVVIGGPAEGWRYNQTGVAVGKTTGRPILQLDDLVTVLRTFSPAGQAVFGCSINPRQEGLKRIKEFVARSQSRGPLSAGAGVRNWVRQLQNQLGVQDIEIYGIPADSRVARVIVEADYRMKLIGVGKMDGGPGIPSFFDLLTEKEQKAATMDALRWWLSMKYDAVLHSPDRQVFEIQGSSVLCRSENQFITDQGKQVQTGKAEATNRLFAENFTNHYAELAQRDLVFAELQNIFDLALVAALLQNHQVLDQVHWDLGVFGPGGAYQPARHYAPLTVDSVVNYRVYRGRDVVVQVAGGVRADLMSVVNDRSIVRSVARLQKLGETTKAPRLPQGRWWWDAAQ